MPYRIEKVTMFCYGEKEAWYKRKVPSGMLPALELDGRMITESDVILSELEAAFGPLYKGMSLICDASLVTPLKANGVARPRAAHEPGVAMAHIEEKKVKTYPELVSSNRCSWLKF